MANPSASAQATSGTARSWLNPLLFTCFFLSGVTGLGYEVLWARYFSLFIGGTTYAHTIVLATFMGGLALGNHIFGKWADRVVGRLRLYGLLELGIGLYGFLFPFLFDALGTGYLDIAGGLGSASLANLPLKLIFAVASILVPTALMGGTLPVLSRFIVRNMGDLGPRVGQLYFINTGGAVIGTFLCGFFLVDSLGLDAATSTFAGFNVAIGVVFLALARLEPKDEASDGEPETSASAGLIAYDRRQVRWALACVAVSGAVSMLYELVWIRLLALVLGSSVHSFSIMLLTFIGGIALGGLVASRLLENPRRDALRLFGWAEIGVFVSVVAMLPVYEKLPFYFHVLSSFFERAGHAFPLYLSVQVLVCVALMFVPTVLIGMTLPLASRIAVQGVDKVGSGVGRAFSLNTLGTLVGAALTGLVLLPWLGLQSTLEVAFALSALLGVLLLRVTVGMTRRRLGVVAATVALVTVGYVVFLPAWDQGVLHAGLFRRKGLVATSYEELKAQRDRMDVLFHEDGPNTSVSVVRHKVTDVLYMKVNGKTDAGTGNDMTTQLWLGHLAMLLHSDPNDVLVIGLGSGITAGAVLRHPGATVDQIEISPAVVRGARLFAEANHDVLDDPRFTLHMGDAKEYFKLNPGRMYDAIISEPSNPWISGIGNLFTREYFREASSHLAPGGLMVQWVHLYEMDDAVLRIILDTFGQVFPAVTIWQCNSADVLLVGSDRPLDASLERISERLAVPEVAADLAQPHLIEKVTDPIQVLGSQILSEREFRRWFPGRPPFNTDDRPILEYAAPRAFFMGAEATILRQLDERRRPPAEGDLLISRYVREHGLSPAQRAALEAHHERRAGAYDKPLQHSLVAAGLAAAPDSPVARGELLRAGDPASVRGLLWSEILDDSQVKSAPALAPTFIADEIARLDAETSVYYVPDKDDIYVATLLAAVAGAPSTGADEVLSRGAELLARRGKWGLAREALENLLRLLDGGALGRSELDRAEILFRLGYAAWQQGDRETALGAFRSVLQERPEFWLVQQLLFQLRAESAQAAT